MLRCQATTTIGWEIALEALQNMAKVGHRGDFCERHVLALIDIARIIISLPPDPHFSGIGQRDGMSPCANMVIEEGKTPTKDDGSDRIMNGDHFYEENGEYFHARTGCRIYLVPKPNPANKTPCLNEERFSRLSPITGTT